MREIGFLGVLLVGCGGASSAPDAGFVSDGELEVRLGPRRFAAPETITVFATGAGGELGEPVTADVDDVLEVAVQSGGAVTAVYQLLTETITVSYLAVEPGDVLVFGDAPAPAPANPNRQIEVSWPAVAGATGYFVFSACGMTSATTELAVTVELSNSCEPEPTTDLVVLARQGDAIAGWERFADVPVDTDPLVVAWQAPLTFTMTAENIADVSGPYLLEAGMVVEGDFSYAFDLEGADPGATATVSGDWARGSETWVVANFQRDGFSGTLIRSDILEADADSWTIDVATMTPAVSAPAKTDDYLQWTQEHSDYDGAVAELRWRRGAKDYRWVGIAPPDFGMRMPPLPEELAGVVPLPSDAGVVLSVRLNDFDDDGDYAAMRARSEWQLVFPRNSSGEVTYSERYSASSATGF